MSYTNNNENLRPSSNSLTNIKVELHTIIRNIEQLESIKASIQHLSDQHSLNSLMLQTDHLLSQVEKIPLERLCKRANKKTVKRLKKSAEKNNSVTSEKKTSDWLSDLVATYSLTNGNDSIETVIPHSSDEPHTTTTIEQHHRLYLRHQGERFQHTLELLEKLHNARGQDQDASREFSSKFQKIRQKWHEALQEDEAESSKQREIEEQWDEVLFGQPKNFHFHKPNDGSMKMKVFFRVRLIWDSYLTRSDEHGTSIPIGFVVPHIDCDARWVPYRAGEQ